MKVVIISASVRKGRNSHRVCQYMFEYFKTHKLADVEVLDLNEYQFPIFEERIKFLNNVPESVKEFESKIRSANGIIIITPEYNGGYPASLKNVIDLLSEVWRKKPVAISTVSTGPFGGMQAITSLQFSMWKIGALVVPAMFPVPNVESAFNEQGEASDKDGADKRYSKFIAELFWYMEAVAKMQIV